jgi:hypothetical protein
MIANDGYGILRTSEDIRRIRDCGASLNPSSLHCHLKRLVEIPDKSPVISVDHGTGLILKIIRICKRYTRTEPLYVARIIPTSTSNCHDLFFEDVTKSRGKPLLTKNTILIS